MLRKDWTFTIAVVMTVAIGIGVNTSDAVEKVWGFPGCA
jgi:hypothetical protein